MVFVKISLWLVLLAIFGMFVEARPRNQLSRQKRVSDQRLAELETLIALSKMKGKLVTVPVGFGRVDPAKVGRRRRSAAKLIRSLIEPDDDSALERNSYESDEEYKDEGDRQNYAENNLLLDLLLNEKIRHRIRTLPD